MFRIAGEGKSDPVRLLGKEEIRVSCVAAGSRSVNESSNGAFIEILEADERTKDRNIRESVRAATEIFSIEGKILVAAWRGAR